MKTTSTNFYRVIIIASVFILSKLPVIAAPSICQTPSLRFMNPVLLEGVALSQGAVYKFANVTPGIDGYIKIKSLNGGAVLVSMESNSKSFIDTWQPVISGPGAPFSNRSWVAFEISFKTTAGAEYIFPSLDVSSFDIDGDGGKIGEFVEAIDYSSYAVSEHSLLTVAELGDGRLRTQGPVSNRPGIDTSIAEMAAHFYFNAKKTIELNLGSYVYNNSYNGAVATERVNCVKFNKTSSSLTVTPVNFRRFNATTIGNTVMLNWVIPSELANDYLEVERSFDLNSFQPVGVVVANSQETQTTPVYQFTDNAAGLKNGKTAYYRLKQTDPYQRVTYSKVTEVKLQSTIGMSMQAGLSAFAVK